MRLQPIVMIKPLARCDYSQKKSQKRSDPNGTVLSRGAVVGAMRNFAKLSPRFGEILTGLWSEPGV
jgi:hypothetical protein